MTSPRPGDGRAVGADPRATRAAAGGRPRRFGRRLAIVAAAAIALCAAWATIVPTGRVAFRTLLFMPDLMPPVTVRPLTWVTDAPVREEIRIVGPAETSASARPSPGWLADVYVPSGRGPFPAIVVSLGINQAARDDPRVRKLGDGLSRLGFVVLIPANDDLRAERMTPDAVAMLVAAFRALAGRADVDAGRIGYFGVCVGASLALIAAEDERIADDVAWVAWFGGYYRIETLIAAVVSRSRPVSAADCAAGMDCDGGGATQPWTVDEMSDRVIRGQVREIVGEEPTAIAYLVGDGATYDGALRVLGGLPAAARARLAALSPATRIDRLRAPLYTMNDVGDTLVPPNETDALIRDAARLGRLARARTFNVFSHVNLDPFSNPRRTLPELWRLYRHVHAIVAPALLH